MGGESGSMGRLVRSVVVGENVLVGSSDEVWLVCRELDASEPVNLGLLLLLGMNEDDEFEDELIELDRFDRSLLSMVIRPGGAWLVLLPEECCWVFVCV
jgi:hypothetical protein